MYLPDYRGRSIVNLMSSIAWSFGIRLDYEPLEALSPEELQESKSIVLLIIDGLGAEYLRKCSRTEQISHNQRPDITSVFPSTTASAMTSICTGTAPAQHGITGWYMNLKELGMVSTILHYRPRFGGDVNTRFGARVEQIIDAKPLATRLDTDCYAVLPSAQKDKVFSQETFRGSKVKEYLTMQGLFDQIKDAIGRDHERQFICAYWPDFDSLAHKFGVSSRFANEQFHDLEDGLVKMMDSLAGKSATIILTADHGIIDSAPDKLIKLEDHPVLHGCLTHPLCGEPRAAYCFVHPSRAKRFEDYVRTQMAGYCELHVTEDLIENNLYGLPPHNPKLMDRIGDYVLIMKDEYVIKDALLNDKVDSDIGNHGGVSREEMLVPLVVMDAAKWKR